MSYKVLSDLPCPTSLLLSCFSPAQSPSHASLAQLISFPQGLCTFCSLLGMHISHCTAGCCLSFTSLCECDNLDEVFLNSPVECSSLPITSSHGCFIFLEKLTPLRTDLCLWNCYLPISHTEVWAPSVGTEPVLFKALGQLLEEAWHGATAYTLVDSVTPHVLAAKWVLCFESQNNSKLNSKKSSSEQLCLPWHKSAFPDRFTSLTVEEMKK